MSIEKRQQNKKVKTVGRSHKRKDKCSGKVSKYREIDITKKR